MDAWELFAVGATLLSVVLTIRQNIWCWPTGIAGVLLYAAVFFRTKLYADMALQGVYVVLSIYGWHEWLHGGRDHSVLAVSRSSRVVRVAAVAIGALGALALGSILHRTTDAALPFADSALTSFSLVAQWLLTKKYLENWIVWIGVDVLYVAMFVYKDLYATAALYAVFMVLATKGYLAWKATLERARA
ncbi:MAG TPA: nicotinamide riboside transporter PnuC [Thermoanaerobaculia bacterium]|nr:nicotinamide riboside transporter PnuC [Thermoanaerobaculia bacterium]